MDKDEYLAEFARRERERIESLKAGYSQYWKSIAEERWREEEKKEEQNQKKDREQTHQRDAQQGKQRQIENKSYTKQPEQCKKAKLFKKKKRKKKKKQEDRQARANAIQRILIEIIAAAGLFQSGNEIHITQEAMLEILAEKYNEPMSKQTLIKHLNFLVNNHFISRQVYVFSNGRGTIQKRTTYRLLPKALRILAGILKLGEKIKRRYYSVGKELKKWIKKEIKKLAGFRIQETKVNMKRWLEKQRFKLLKRSHPAVLMLESE